jgi:hypothetical protein
VKGTDMAAKSKSEYPTLVHPDGRDYVPSSAQEATRLVSAEGYTLKDPKAKLPDPFTEGLAKLHKSNAADAKTTAKDTTSGEDAGTSRTGTDTASTSGDGAKAGTGSTGTGAASK